jgi:hypothetical protein
MRHVLFALAFLAAPVMLVACGRPPSDRAAATAAAPGVAAVVVIADPDLAARLVGEAPADEPPPPATRAEGGDLPPTWTGPVVPGLTFSDAIHRAREARDAYARLGPPMVPAAGTVGKPGVVTPTTIPADGPIKVWFSRAQSLVDQASRMYAAAFHAPDAPREGRIDAIAEAAELDMTMARRLDEAGLGSLPQGWRSDPGVGSTFEDVAVGPMRRWRDEARVLARACVETAREIGVATEAARRCAALRTGAVPRVSPNPSNGTSCACSPGDPLCSATLGGWCATH